MQYRNGGSPRYYPNRGGYRYEITYDNNAMIRTCTVLRAVTGQQGPYAAVAPNLAAPAKDTVAHGLDCILKTQYRRRG